jgi:hypothetical protein
MSAFRPARIPPLRLAEGGPMSNRRASPKPRPWLIEAIVLIYEITAAADRIAVARDADGTRIAATDTQSRMLRVLGRAWGRLSISDIGRRLRISRQAARNLVVAAAQARERAWAITLLNGLDVRTMRATSHILRVIRLRLVRDERARGG